MDNKGHWHSIAVAEKPSRDEGQDDDMRRTYVQMEVGEHVEIVKADGTRMRAMFWEAKGNKVVLRTLPTRTGE